MKRHTTLIVVEDEVNTPRLRILVYCRECEVLVSQRLVDVSTIQPGHGREVGEAFATVDVDAWQAHEKAGKR